MEFFSKNFFQWLGAVASIFLITIGALNIPDLPVLTKVILAIFFDLTFIVAILVFIIFQFRDREINILNEYYKAYNSATSLEVKNKNLQDELLSAQKSLNDLYEYVTGLEYKNVELNEKITNLSNALKHTNSLNLTSPLDQLSNPTNIKRFE